MVLFPRKTKFKKFFKFTKLFNKFENRYSIPKVGVSGLKLIKGGRINFNQLESIRKVCRKKLKSKFKKEIPRFSLFSDIGVSKKSSGLRMGKGKGALEFWACFGGKGRVILELSSNVTRFGSLTALKAASFKLPYRSKIIFV